MHAYILANFLVYVIINCFTPGPGNILALNTALKHGPRRGRPLFLGIFAGYYSVQLLCAFMVYGAGRLSPQLYTLIRYAGAAYMLWLAFSIITSRPDSTGSEQPVRFIKGFLLQFINIKIYLFGITALSCHIVKLSSSLGILVLAELFIASVGVVATSTWVAVGTLIQSTYLRRYRLINAILAVFMLECVYSTLR